MDSQAGELAMVAAGIYLVGKGQRSACPREGTRSVVLGDSWTGCRSVRGDAIGPTGSARRISQGDPQYGDQGLRMVNEL